MKLTKDQIESLYQFTRQHFVEYYDLQTELVDHLSNDIECIWQEQPSLSFREARDKAFKKFGVYGFMDVIGERQKSLNKKYMKILGQFTKQWFGLPKLIITLTLFLVLFTLLNLQTINAVMFYGVFLIFIGYTAINMFKLNKQYKSRQKRTDKKWLFEEIIFKTSIGNLAAVLVNVINISSIEKSLENPLWVGFIALLFTLMFLFAKITLQIIPSKAETLLEETYPEYRLT